MPKLPPSLRSKANKPTAAPRIWRGVYMKAATLIGAKAIPRPAIVTTRGNKSGKIRKTPLMRVEHGGEYALVASQGGAPTHPVWYYNLTADPDSVTIQDGPTPFAVSVREIEGDERAVWWERAVAAFSPYAQYQLKTERRIPVFLATKKS